MTESTNLSPWAHPKAKHWFNDLIEDNMFAISLDDALMKSENKSEFDQIRVMLAIALLLGREGIWPANRNNVLRAVVRAASKISKSASEPAGDRPLTIAQHQGHTRHDEAIQHEVELMRRRLKMSNRKSSMNPPASWGNLWE